MEEKKRRWEEIITSTNMTHNRPQTWKTIRKLSNDLTTSSPPCLVSAMAEVTWHSHQNVLHYHSNRRRYLHGIPFQQRGAQESSGITKDNKAAGRDDVLVEQLKNIGPKAHMWFLAMLNECFMENKIPTIWRQSQNIVIRKPGKY